MPKLTDDPYRTTTAPFTVCGERQFVEVIEFAQRVRRCRWPSGEVIEEVQWPVSGPGCYIHEIAASHSGDWLVTQRITGQGEWGYDVFRAAPLDRVAGVTDEKGYILETPRFAPDESLLVGGAGHAFLSGRWAHPEDDLEDPARGGPVTLGFVFVHRLPSHAVTRHMLEIDLPAGWVPDDPDAAWYGPTGITPTPEGVRMLPSWGVPVLVPWPLPAVIRLPVPHPSGAGLL